MKDNINLSEVRKTIPAKAVLEYSIIKLDFLSHAIQNVWGDKETIYGQEVIFGAYLLMRDIVAELEEIQERLQTRL